MSERALWILNSGRVIAPVTAVVVRNNSSSNVENAGPRRGAVLFEVVIAIALFAGAAAFTLSALRSVYTALEQAQLQQEAVDLARTKMTELEAGLITLADLRGDAATSTDDHSDQGNNWTFDLHTRRTEFTGLTLVELTVRQDVPESADSTPMSFTLRQLVELRGGGSDE